MIKTVNEENPIGKKPLGRPRISWKEYAKREIITVVLEANWKETAEDRETWKKICCTGWS